MDALRVENLARNFGGLRAINGVSLRVAPGERRAIIGPNGAGKTTLFNLISGELIPHGGRVYFEEQDITRMPAYARARHGLARTFQRNNLFLNLTVFENVRLAVQCCAGISGNALRPADQYFAVSDKTAALLRQLGLWDYRTTLARHLSHGFQRQLEFALALATEPRILLLDEPTAGMSPAETASTVESLRALPRELTLLIIEHDMDVIFALADRITALHYGQVIADGSAEEVRNNPRVLEIYLGENTKV
jgi:branched-chain amino acid transport system ATP-binding protein